MMICCSLATHLKIVLKLQHSPDPSQVINGYSNARFFCLSNHAATSLVMRMLMAPATECLLRLLVAEQWGALESLRSRPKRHPDVAAPTLTFLPRPRDHVGALRLERTSPRFAHPRACSGRLNSRVPGALQHEVLLCGTGPFQTMSPRRRGSFHTPSLERSRFHKRVYARLRRALAGSKNGPGSAVHHCAQARYVLHCARDKRSRSIGICFSFALHTPYVARGRSRGHGARRARVNRPSPTRPNGTRLRAGSDRQARDREDGANSA
jgi:hypothetical protein